MPNKSTINFSTILRRSTCLNSNLLSESKVDNVEKLYDRLLEAVESTKDGKDYTITNSINLYVEAMSSVENATKYYWQPLKILSEMDKRDLTNVANMFNHQYVTRILPYLEDISLVKDDIDRFTITEDQSNYITNTLSKLSIADRILGNYESLSKRFNLESAVVKYSTGGLKSFVDLIAEMVDTYNTKNYQKMNVTIEEVDYILSKEGIKYDKSDMVKYVAEYYLSQSPYLTDKDIDNYQRTLNENYILTESDLDSVKYVLNSTCNVSSIQTGINNFLLIKNKSPEVLSESISNMLEKTNSNDIVYNSYKITNLLWDLTKNAVFESDESLYSLNSIVSDYVVKSIEENNSYSKEEVDILIESYKNSMNDIRLSGNSNPDYAKASVQFIDNSIKPCIESLTTIRDILYDKSNLNTIEYLQNENATILPLAEFKIFKFHNLIRAAFNLDKFLKVKEKKLIDNGKNKVSKFMKKAKNVLFGEAANETEMLKYIGEDGKACLVLRQYILDESDSIEDIQKFLRESCNEYNDILLSQNNTCRAYYIINPGIAEIRIKEPTRADISNVDIYSSLDESVDTYLNILGEVNYELDIDDLKFRTIYENIEMMNNSKSFTFDQFELALEAMSIIGSDKSDVELLANEFVEYNFNNAILGGNINGSYMNLTNVENRINSLVENWVALEDVEFEDKLEAYSYLQSIFEYSFPSSDDEDDEDEEDEEEEDKKEEKKQPEKKDNKKESEKKEEKKDETDVPEMPKLDPPKGKIAKAQRTLNSIRLGLEGLKAKFKDLDTKHKESARNMDNAARAFATATKNALISDRREAIIKGSVIPSFSRCIKAAIILAGVAHFSLPAAVIGAVGTLAVSKKLTKTERLLLLDEIETELEVVEKELAIADSNNQINKYRELLKYKKNLQRQYQRIKYNVRVGKDILPGSAVGVPHGDE